MTGVQLEAQIPIKNRYRFPGISIPMDVSFQYSDLQMPFSNFWQNNIMQRINIWLKRIRY